MLKMIFIQLWNRKRNNLWILVELLLIFCLVWYMVDYFFVLGYNESLPMNRNIDHCWQVNVKQLSAEHPDYIAGESDSTALEDNYARVLDRLRRCEGVEAVAVMSTYSSPNSGSYMGNGYRNAQDSLKESWGRCCISTRVMTSSGYSITVRRITSLCRLATSTGQTPGRWWWASWYRTNCSAAGRGQAGRS
ncbi:MAG: hypothetical protein LUD46_04890 [Parabacteroides sp.]|nr:hypothetical protein [Parabacteroides sp.]